MTKAQLRTLELVKAGKCHRVYSETGNTMHGAHAATLWKFERDTWIRDGKMVGSRWCWLELTPRGEKELAASRPVRGIGE